MLLLKGKVETKCITNCFAENSYKDSKNIIF